MRAKSLIEMPLDILYGNGAIKAKLPTLMKMLPSFSLPLQAVMLLAVLQSASPECGARTFRSEDGKSIEAEVISVQGTTVTLQRSDGRRFTHPLSHFTAADQAALRGGSPAPAQASVVPQTPLPTVEPALAVRPPSPLQPAAKPHQLDVRITSGKSDRVSKIEMFDDRSLRLKFQVSITSRELNRELAGAKGTLVILGKSVLDPSEYGVLGREEFSVDVSPRKPFQYEGKSFTTEYDDKGGSSRFGFRYLGYVFVLLDAEGRLIRADALPDAYSKLADKALALQPLQVVDRNFDPVKGIPSTRVTVRNRG